MQYIINNGLINPVFVKLVFPVNGCLAKEYSIDEALFLMGN